MLQRLHVHLAMLRRDGGISEWYDREIRAGGDIDREVSIHLEACDIFLALLSQDFLNSKYCYEKEMARAIERHEAGDLVIVPIILEPVSGVPPLSSGSRLFRRTESRLANGQIRTMLSWMSLRSYVVWQLPSLIPPIAPTLL